MTGLLNELVSDLFELFNRPVAFGDSFLVFFALFQVIVVIISYFLAQAVYFGIAGAGFVDVFLIARGEFSSDGRNGGILCVDVAFSVFLGLVARFD